MDVAALATAFAGASAAKLQMAAAAKMMKMNADAQGAVVQVLEAAQENMKALVAAGIGGNLDISV
jgi:fatty acid-binding protein DegV